MTWRNRRQGRDDGSDRCCPNRREPRLTAIAKEFHPAVILISGCQDNQTSMDGDHNGAFTEQVLKAWNHGNYGELCQIPCGSEGGLPASQSPNLFTLGRRALLRQQPFKV